MARPRTALGRLHRLIEAAREGAAPRQYASIVRLFSDDHLRQLGRPADAAAWRPGNAAYTAMPPGDWPDEPDPVHAAMRWDLMHYLPFDLLRKVDRASMAVALEVRCPLLDTQVCDLAGHLPTSVLLPGGQAKGLLKQVAAEYLPPAIIHRPKRGFAVPIGLWFRGLLRDSLRQYIFEGGLTTLGIDRYAVESMLEDHLRGAADHTHRLFALLTLSMWAAWLRRPAPPPVMITPQPSRRL
jgi:asparagine synthase (glutamine-hydrolysing)